MNSFQAVRLIWEIYYKKGLPDLDRIQSYGLLAVKIGQIHALRLDFLPREKCEHLSKLYRKASPVPIEDVESLFAFHSPDFKNNFSKIDEKPLAVASVGQVYRARLVSGQNVVVKAIKKNFKKRFLGDVRKLRFFLRMILLLFPKLKGVGNPIGILDDIEEYTTAELDLRNEIQGRNKLKKIYENYESRFNLSKLSFGRLYEEISGENVLVSDFIDAKTIDELLSLGKFSYSDMLDFFYLQGFYIFIAGKFHGDIHPGNIMYDGHKFFFVDTAFVGEVGDKIRKGLFRFFEALSRYDYKKCAFYLNEMAESGISNKVYDVFEKNFFDIYKDFRGKTVSEVSLTRQMMLTIKLGVNSGMKFEKGIFAIIRSLMYLDGMVLKCNPKAILMEDMRRFVDRYKDVL